MAASRPTLAPAYALALAACTAFALWLVWPAFEPGRIVNLDSPRHLLRAEVMTKQFLPSGHVDGWAPWWYLGAQLFLFQSYGYFFVIGATALALSPLVGLGAVFKFWYAAPMVVLPAAIAHMATKLGVSRAGAVAAAITSLALSSPLGFGMEGLFGIGLLLQAVGVVGFALAWPELLALLQGRSPAPWRAALLVGAVLLVHFISGAYLLGAGGLAAAYLAVRARDARPLARYGVLALLVLLLAAHSLFPSFELRELAGSGVGWGSERDRFARLLAGTLFGAQPLALAALAAAAWSLWRGSPALFVTAAVFFATALLGGTDSQGWEPPWLSEPLRLYVRPRALPYAAAMQAVFTGVALDLAVAEARRRLSRDRAKLALAVALALVSVVALPEAAGQRRRVATEARLTGKDRRVYLHLVNWLKKNTTLPAIVAMPRTLMPRRSIGARSVVSLLNLDTGLYSLSGDQAELTRAVRRPDRIDLDSMDQGSGRTARLLREAGVAWVIVAQPTTRAVLASRSDDFELVYDDPGRPGKPRRRRRGGSDAEGHPGVAVFRLVGGGQWLQGEGLEVLAMRHAPERIVFDVRLANGPKLREAVSAVNWHPDWTATVDGKPVAVRRSESGRVALDLPRRAARVTLEFVRSAREKAWNALSAATLALVLAMEARRLLRTRRTAKAPR